MISVIIVNHNGVEHIQRCLESLDRQKCELEVVLVDNDSSDGSLALVQREFPGVRILEHQENLGFAAANNAAAEIVVGEALLLLNVDAWLEEGALDHLVRALDRDPRLALVAPRLVYPGGGLQFNWSPARGVFGEFLQQLRNRFEDRSWAHGRLAWWVGRVVGENWFTAACVLVRSVAFREVGGFDERFFMYFEDVDLCMRLEAAGWRLTEERRAVVRHVGGFARDSGVDALYRPAQLSYYRLHRPAWEASFIERRMRRRFGDAVVNDWLGVESDAGC